MAVFSDEIWFQTFEQYNSLYKVLGAFYEALRMFRELFLSSCCHIFSFHCAASGNLLIRESMEDTVLTLPKPLGEEGSKTWPIPKGIWVSQLLSGSYHNE